MSQIYFELASISKNQISSPENFEFTRFSCIFNYQFFNFSQLFSAQNHVIVSWSVTNIYKLIIFSVSHQNMHWVPILKEMSLCTGCLKEMFSTYVLDA